MKEYLFRGKRIDNNEWLEGGYAVIHPPPDLNRRDPTAKPKVYIVAKYDNSTADWGNPCQMTFYEVYPATVGRFTGIPDRNEKRIFEGHIVRMHYFFKNFHPSTLGIFEDEKEIIGVVGIDKYGPYTQTKTGKYYWFLYLQEPSEELEIIGDSYDNQELLKEVAL